MRMTLWIGALATIGALYAQDISRALRAGGSIAAGQSFCFPVE